MEAKNGLQVYVAGAWVEQHFRARPMMARLRVAGIEITYDWSQPEGDVCACGHPRQEHQPFKSGPRSREVGCAHDLSLDVQDERASLEPRLCPCEVFNGIGTATDSDHSREDRIKHATSDLEGVLNANVVWLLAENGRGARGSWFELGAATTAKYLRAKYLNPPALPIIVVSGEKCRGTVFTELADVLVPSDEEALRHILLLHQTAQAAKGAP